jgi:cytochrome c-type biogenesis protein
MAAVQARAAELGCTAIDLLRWRTHFISGGAHARMLFAIVLVAIGVMVLTGLDKSIETFAVNESPLWLTDLTTRF